MTPDSLVRSIVIVVAALVLLPALVMATTMPLMGLGGWGHMGDGGHMWHGWMWEATGPTWSWVLVSVLPLIVLLGLGYLAIRVASDERSDPAIDALREAYARGTLSEDEYEQRRATLERTG